MSWWKLYTSWQGVIQWEKEHVALETSHLTGEDYVYIDWHIEMLLHSGLESINKRWLTLRIEMEACICNTRYSAMASSDAPNSNE